MPTTIRRALVPVLALLLGCGSEGRKPAGAGGSPSDSAAAAGPAATSFDTTLTWKTISFHVTGSGGKVTVESRGLEADNSTLESEITGSVAQVEIDDINNDTWPELMIYTVSDDSSRYGGVVGYSSNNGKSMSQIAVPDLDRKASVGYRGQDEFAIAEAAFVRRFPIYDAAGRKTGKMRQIQYHLVDGEASRALKPYKTIEF